MAAEEFAAETSETESSPLREMDTLHTLPLSMVPVESAGLRKLTMKKNYALESVVEAFQMRGGSYQIEIGNLGQLFNWPADEEHPDLTLLHAVGMLRSFDIYSLRNLLREFGHAVDDDPNLKIPDTEAAGLSEYMTAFTRPLMSRIYGDEAVEINNPKDLVAVFNDPDRAKVLQRLQTMARELGIEIVAVPGFLEEYTDVLLSLAFFKRCLDQLTPIVTVFLGTMNTVTSNQMLRRDETLMDICTNVESQVNELMAEIAQRFQTLDQVSADIWSNASEQGFKELEETVRDHHTNISGVLCGLSVKMGIWDEMFSNKEDVSPAQLADFIKFQMKRGLEIMQKVEVQIVTWQ